MDKTAKKETDFLTKEELQALPDFVQKLIKNTNGFESLFLGWNKNYLEDGRLDYLPDFEKKEDGGNPYWIGKMKWRYVGWENNTRYTGENLREIRRLKGVGNSKKRLNAEKETNESLSG